MQLTTVLRWLTLFTICNGSLTPKNYRGYTSRSNQRTEYPKSLWNVLRINLSRFSNYVVFAYPIQQTDTFAQICLHIHILTVVKMQVEAI